MNQLDSWKWQSLKLLYSGYWHNFNRNQNVYYNTSWVLLYANIWSFGRLRSVLSGPSWRDTSFTWLQATSYNLEQVWSPLRWTTTRCAMWPIDNHFATYTLIEKRKPVSNFAVCSVAHEYYLGTYDRILSIVVIYNSLVLTDACQSYFINLLLRAVMVQPLIVMRIIQHKYLVDGDDACRCHLGGQLNGQFCGPPRFFHPITHLLFAQKRISDRVHWWLIYQCSICAYTSVIITQ